MKQQRILFLLAVTLASPAMAGEGLWLLNPFPKPLVEKRYQFQG